MAINLSSENKEVWIEHIEDFKNIVYPDIFKPFGFTLQEALLCWTMNELKNAIYNVEDKIEEKL